MFPEKHGNWAIQTGGFDLRHGSLNAGKRIAACHTALFLVDHQIQQEEN